MKIELSEILFALSIQISLRNSRKSESILPITLTRCSSNMRKIKKGEFRQNSVGSCRNFYSIVNV